MEKDKLEELREELHRAIENHGRDSLEVLIISQKLDICIVEELKKRKNKKKTIKFNNSVF